jgi:hypothetical protein
MLEVRRGRKTSQEGVNGNNSLPQMFICFRDREQNNIFRLWYEIDLLHTTRNIRMPCHSAALEQT